MVEVLEGAERFRQVIEQGARVAPSSPAYSKLNEAVDKMLKAEMERTLKLLKENCQHLDAEMGALIERKRLTAEDLQGISLEMSRPEAQAGRTCFAQERG